jgi:hypothetical protein
MLGHDTEPPRRLDKQCLLKEEVWVHSSIDTFSITLGAIFPAKAVASPFPYLISFGVVAVVLIVLTGGRLDYQRLAEVQSPPRVR